MPVEALRLRALAAALTLLSGAVMMLAGYVAESDGWAPAGFISIAGGIVILAAFALARRADQAAGRTAAPGRRPRGGAAVVIGATLLSGGVMVFAGYAASAWGWGWAAPLAVVGGVIIGVAFLVDRRGAGAGHVVPSSRAL
jgi:hypothetical protein